MAAAAESGEADVEEVAAEDLSAEDLSAENLSAREEQPVLAGLTPPTPTGLPNLSTSDPKVVIAPATPAAPSTPAAPGAAAEQAISTLDAPREQREDSQPKRRGWWNRFV